MGNKQSWSETMKDAEEHWKGGSYSSDVIDFLWKTLDSTGKSGQPRKIIPSLNIGGIKKGIDKAQDVLVSKWSKDNAQDMLVSKLRKDKDMAELVFGSSGIGGWLVGLAFSLLTQSNSETLSMEDIKKTVERAVLGIMSSDKINNLKGAMKSIIDTTFIDETSSDYSDILYTDARDLRKELNKLKFSMESDPAYATLETLDSFMSGWGMVSSVYLTVHNMSPEKVTYDGYKKQVETAKTEILEASNLCYKVHVAQIKIRSRSIAHGGFARTGDSSPHYVYLTFKEIQREIHITKNIPYIEKRIEDCLANSYTKFKRDRIESRIPALE